MAINIALAGNPNCGKTTIFNILTGSSQKIGNWPGVTVEKKTGVYKKDKNVLIQDLPGTYSLSAYSPEEKVAMDYLLNGESQAVIDIVDASSLERGLYLTTQLLELDMPVVLALNMSDVVKNKGDYINFKKLGSLLGLPVVETTATKGSGLEPLAKIAISAAKEGKAPTPQKIFSNRVEQAIGEIEKLISEKSSEKRKRWNAIRLFEHDESIAARLGLDSDTKAIIHDIVKKVENEMEDDAESIVTFDRYAFIENIISECVVYKDRNALTTSDKIDKIVTNRFLALPIFAAAMTLIYYISITTIGTAMTDWVNDSLFGEILPPQIDIILENTGTAPWLSSLIQNGIIAGVGAVLGFLPQMFTLFICLAIIEDCGYMARVAFIMDRIFRKFGLSGKSFIPMLIATGCGVPGIMASRAIENDNDRRMTVMTATFIPCGAKLPVIALIAGAIFPAAVWLAPSAYFIGIVAIILSGVMLKKLSSFQGETVPFIIELPAYHLPSFRTVINSALRRCWAFVQRATTIVMLATILIWFLSSYSFQLQEVEMNDSMLAGIGRLIAPIFSPLGWGDWQAAIATITGLIAKENVVGTFGVLYGFGEVAEDGAEYWEQLSVSFTQIAAYSFLTFNLLCAPCAAAIGAIRREMMDGKWTAFAICYQCGFAYVISLIIYQTGIFIQTGIFTSGTIMGICAFGTIVYFLLRKPAKNAMSKIGNKYAMRSA